MAEPTQAEKIKAAAEVSLMYLQTGFIECPQCGEEVQTKTLDAAYELATVVEPAPTIGGTIRSEPVPETGQVGEVKAWLYQREGCASVVAKNQHRWANADGWVETPLIAALATQPATSQEGEDEDVIHDCGNLGWCQAPGYCSRHDIAALATQPDDRN